MLLQTGLNTLKLSKKLLGTEEAWLWVGFGFGPKDNDDERVLKTRELMEKYYPYVPYGMWVGNRRADGSMEAIVDTDSDGYYGIDLSWWPEGAYRLNVHTQAGEASSVGSVLREQRDGEVSWAPLDSDIWNDEEKESLRPFLYKEENGAGYSLRILIKPNRTVEAFGDNL